MTSLLSLTNQRNPQSSTDEPNKEPLSGPLALHFVVAVFIAPPSDQFHTPSTAISLKPIHVFRTIEPRQFDPMCLKIAAGYFYCSFDLVGSASWSVWTSSVPRDTEHCPPRNPQVFFFKSLSTKFPTHSNIFESVARFTIQITLSINFNNFQLSLWRHAFHVTSWISWLNSVLLIQSYVPGLRTSGFG